jgi:hypothetical protein
MKRTTRWKLALLLAALVPVVALVFWPGTSSGMYGAYLFALPNGKGPAFDPHGYTEAVKEIVREQGFEPAGAEVPDRWMPNEPEDVFIPPGYTREYSGQCTANLRIFVRPDRVAIYVGYPRASMFDQWRIGWTVESLRKSLRPLQEKINRERMGIARQTRQHPRDSAIVYWVSR